MSNNDLLLNTRVSLALISFYSHLILALAAANSAWGVKTVIVSLLKVFKSPTAALPVTVFFGIIIRVLGNSK